MPIREMTAGTLIIFLKAPVAGRVKTRLGAEIGMGRAAALFRIMTARTLAEAGKGAWRTILAIDPPGALNQFGGLWPGKFERVAQSGGSLGRRMKEAFDTASRGPAVIIGADCPGLRARHIREAFFRLRGADAVFGPAEDGGYWLIGLARRRAAPELFAGVRWSTRHALRDTLASLPELFKQEFLPTLADVDEVQDLTHIRAFATGGDDRRRKGK